MVATIYGAMFAPRPERVADELARVCRPGGIIAMANWTAEGFIGQMFRTIGQFIAPPGMPSPLLWGREDTVTERFGASVDRLRLTRVVYRFSFPFSPADVVDFFRRNYGPTNRAFETLGLHRIHAAFLPVNMASRRVLEKNGFREEGYAENYLQIDGKWCDHVLFGLTRERYLAAIKQPAR